MFLLKIGGRNVESFTLNQLQIYNWQKYVFYLNERAFWN